MAGGRLGNSGLGNTRLGTADGGAASALAGLSAGSSVVSGALLLDLLMLAGQADGTSVVAGDLTVTATIVSLEGQVSGAAVVTGTMTMVAALTGTSNGASVVSNGGSVGLTIDGEDGIILIVFDADGTQHDFTQFTCEESFECGGKSNGGPDSARWNMPFPANVIPDDYARVSLFDAETGVEFWRGRFTWELPEWDGCSSLLNAKAEGMLVALSDQSFGAAAAAAELGTVRSVVYGPQIVKINAVPPAVLPPPSLIGTVLALTPEDAITHAVSQLCPDVSLPAGSVATTGALLTERTRDFFLGNALSVINYMTGLFDYLLTPYIWNVRPRVGVAAFSWQPMPSTPRYRVSLAGTGAKLNIVRQPAAIANRAIVGYGGYQSRTSPAPPAAISYDEIPIIRDAVVNLMGQANRGDNAQQVADGIIAKGSALRLGWQYSLSIPRACPIYDDDNGGVIIAPWMIEEGNVIQVDDIDVSLFGSNHSPPEEHFVTEWKWSGSGTLTINCGETRKQEDVAAIRSVMSQADRINPVLKDARFPMREIDAPKIEISRVGLGAGPGPDASGHNFDIPLAIPPPNPGLRTGGVPDQGSLNQQVPQQQAQHPPVGTFNFIAADVAAGGLVASAILGVGPLTIESWEINANVPVTFEVSFVLGSTGLEVLHVRMDAGTAVATAWGGATTQRQQISPTVDLEEMDDQLIPYITVTSADLDLAAAAVTVNFRPLFPGFPDLGIDDDGNVIIDVWDGMGRSV